MSKKKKTKLIPLVVERSKWLRGGKDGDGMGASSTLLNSDGHMCCLGFACKTLGFRDSTIFSKGSPTNAVRAGTASALRHRKLRMSALITADGSNSEATWEAMSINDSDDVCDADRENQLKPVLKKLGFAVKFVD